MHCASSSNTQTINSFQQAFKVERQQQQHQYGLWDLQLQQEVAVVGGGTHTAVECIEEKKQSKQSQPSSFGKSKVLSVSSRESGEESILLLLLGAAKILLKQPKTILILQRNPLLLNVSDPCCCTFLFQINFHTVHNSSK